MLFYIALKLNDIARHWFQAIDVAQVTGTAPDTVSRWGSGKSAPQGEYLHRLIAFEDIVRRLADLYTPDEARPWIYSRHELLDGKIPADLIQAGRADEVLRAVDQLADGVYL